MATISLMNGARKIRIFINGFGRIGRSSARILLHDSRFTICGINDIYPFSQMVSRLQYDSVYGAFDRNVSLSDMCLIVGSQKIPLFNIPHPERLPLEELETDLVLECSGYFLTQEACEPFLRQGARKVLISTPPQDNMPVYVKGVNETVYSGEPIVSNSSCSVNAIAPLLKIVETEIPIRSAMFSMVHSYTSYQRLLDSRHYASDIRRTRSATQNIIPLQSSAAEATARLFPHLRGRLYARSIRVPTSAVTFYDLTLRSHKAVTTQKVRNMLTEVIESACGDILEYTTEPKVSTDFIGNRHSVVVDLPLCRVHEERLLRIAAWQDNEYGYACRLVDMAAVVGSE